MEGPALKEKLCVVEGSGLKLARSFQNIFSRTIKQESGKSDTPLEGGGVCPHNLPEKYQRILEKHC